MIHTILFTFYDSPLGVIYDPALNGDIIRVFLSLPTFQALDMLAFHPAQGGMIARDPLGGRVRLQKFLKRRCYYTFL